jgi:hypothetical protein
MEPLVQEATPQLSPTWCAQLSCVAHPAGSEQFLTNTSAAYNGSLLATKRFCSHKTHVYTKGMSGSPLRKQRRIRGGSAGGCQDRG